MKKTIFTLCAAVALTTTGCDDILDIDNPTNALSADATYSTAEGIRAAETGLYTGNYHNNQLYYQALDLYFPMFSDEMNHRLTSWAEYYQNTYNTSNSTIQNLWYYPYFSIYQSNDFIGHIEGSTLLDEATRRAYEGEARFFRAYSYLFLVSSFGDVPLILTSDYKEAAKQPRTDKAEVWRQIIVDLTTAEEYLTGFKNPKTRITADAATALLARAYLYTGQWAEAAANASRLIPVADGGDGVGGYQLESVDRVFRANSREAINQFNCEGFTGSNTYIGYTRIGALWVPSGKTVTYRLTDTLVADLKAEAGDARTHWIDSVVSGSATYYYPAKYRNNDTPASSDENEYYVFQRLAELYLIRAEANAQLDNLTAAAADLNRIRQRASLPPLAEGLTKEQLLTAVENERRKELFCEQGHRWFDLSRTGRADAVYEALGYKKWSSHKRLLPVPEKEILNNHNLTQNSGYDVIR